MRGFIAWTLICVSVLWLALTGACTAFFAYQGWLGSNPANITTHALGESVLFLSLAIGAICMAPGVVVLIIGLFLRPRRVRGLEPQGAVKPPGS